MRARRRRRTLRHTSGRREGAQAHVVALQRDHRAQEAVHLLLAVVERLVRGHVVATHERKDAAVKAVALLRRAFRVDHLTPRRHLHTAWRSRTRPRREHVPHSR